MRLRTPVNLLVCKSYLNDDGHMSGREGEYPDTAATEAMQTIRETDGFIVLNNHRIGPMQE